MSPSIVVRAMPRDGHCFYWCLYTRGTVEELRDMVADYYTDHPDYQFQNDEDRWGPGSRAAHIKCIRCKSRHTGRLQMHDVSSASYAAEDEILVLCMLLNQTIVIVSDDDGQGLSFLIYHTVDSPKPSYIFTRDVDEAASYIADGIVVSWIDGHYCLVSNFGYD